MTVMSRLLNGELSHVPVHELLLYIPVWGLRSIEVVRCGQVTAAERAERGVGKVGAGGDFWIVGGAFLVGGASFSHTRGWSWSARSPKASASQ